MILRNLSLFVLSYMCILAIPQDAFPGLSVDRRTDPAAMVLGNLKNAPRIMLFINEKTAGLRSANFEQALAEVLRQYKIRVVDPGQVSALYDQGNAGTLKAYSGDIQAAIKTGIANRADIVIIGGVQTSSGAVYSMQSGQADIALKAVLCAKSRTLASGNLHAAALQVTAESAKIAAIRKAAQQVVPKNGGRSTFLTDMLAAWKKTK